MILNPRTVIPYFRDLYCRSNIILVNCFVDHDEIVLNTVLTCPPPDKGNFDFAGANSFSNESIRQHIPKTT